MSKKSKNQMSKNIAGANLGSEATSILTKNLSTVTQKGAAGSSVNDMFTDEVTLSCVVFDETGSMGGDETAVVMEFGDDLQAIKDSKQADEIFMSLWAFNTSTRVIHSYLPLDMVAGITDYHPCGGTALFDAVLDAFTALIAYEQELINQGQRTKINLAVFTDGEDNSSSYAADDVRKVAEDLLAKENCTLTLIAFGQGFAQTTAADMGFPNVLEVGRNASERRRAFGTWSKSVIKTSQTKIGGSQSGFFTP